VVLITADQNIPDQQNLAGRKISLLILCAPTNRLSDLQLLVSQLLVSGVIVALGTIVSGEVVRIR
jgi:hypothetical protein